MPQILLICKFLHIENARLILLTANKVLPKLLQNRFDWTFEHGSTFVLRMKSSVKNPCLRQYPYR